MACVVCRFVAFVALLALTAGRILAAETVWPAPDWPRADPAKLDLDATRLEKARDYALTGGGSGMIVVAGRVVMTWGDLDRTYDLKSTTKSIGVTALGLAIADGKLRLGDKARKHHPALGVPPESNRETSWIDDITILHLATQTAGFEKPGGYGKLLFAPGSKWHYSDAGPNWLAECVALAYRRDVSELMFERVFAPLGIDERDLKWRKNAYRAAKIDGIERREFGSGISANVDAMARIGYLYLRGGKWRDKEILPKNFVDAAGTTVDAVVGLAVVEPKNYGKASDHYGLLWWNNADGTLRGVPKDAYWSWGLYDSLIVVAPSLDLVVARAGKSWRRTSEDHYSVLQPFLGPIVAAIPTAAANDGDVEGAKSASAYPPSAAIRGIEWDSPERIVRKAKDSDNWPLTWGDDDCLYTAYGDGTGFKPKTDAKLSLGLAKISGGPTDFVGVNVRSPAAEQKGDGAAGKKASGMLMVRGVLYMWARNAGNSQLAWSNDRGESWTWSDWKFATSFGCPTFLNFGKNYAGARDGFVYVYSHDADSAYEAADRMVLARVPLDRIADRAAYEFFEKLDDGGLPRWTREIRDRGGVFVNAGKCYRNGISYNAALRRYLWCHTLGKDARFRGGLAIYDAPQPWGPWTTVYAAERWDVGPGETSSFPTKWMSDDGRTMFLVFSGDDAFSVRKATLSVANAASAKRRPPSGR